MSNIVTTWAWSVEGLAADGKLERVPCGVAIVAYRMPHIAQEIAS